MTASNKTRYPRIMVTIIICLLVVGCTSPIGRDLTVTPTTTPDSHATLTEIFPGTIRPSETAEITINATTQPRVTQTVQPALTPHKSSTPISTVAAVPTLYPDEALEITQDLYADNGGCQLPCWWGIVPGEAIWNDIYASLSQLGNAYGPIENNGISRYDLEIVVPSEIDSYRFITPGFWVENEIVQAIGLNSGWIRKDFDYSLAGWMELLGQPEEIWLELYLESITEPHYNLHLFYPSQGLLILLDGNAQVANNVMTICPQDILGTNGFPPGIRVWDPEEKIPYKLLEVEVFGGLSNLNSDAFVKLESLSSSFTVEEFYRTFLDPNSQKCMDIDISQINP